MNVAVPRYTSYPTAYEWKSIDASFYRTVLQECQQDPLSVYVHIPFCHSMCLYCGCSVVLNRDPEKEIRYVRALLREIEQTAALFPKKKQVAQVHFGGGTPTKLTSSLLSDILEALSEHFTLLPSAEIAIEVDPRSVVDGNFEKLADIKKMGFNRISLGVQDTNEKVQDAVRRRQSADITKRTFQKARDLAFLSINVDLIYGLPFQTRGTFRSTIHTIGDELKPDRIALFSYAKVPWLKPHQKAIPDQWLPTAREKYLMGLMARHDLVGLGYCAIGLDHFAHAQDPIAERFLQKSLKRNFQGYTVLDCDAMIGFGLTAISEFDIGYFQNTKLLEEYYDDIEKGAVQMARRGVVFSCDDRIRKQVIHELMCHFEIDMAPLEKKWQIDAQGYFAHSFKALAWYVEKGFVEIERNGAKIIVTRLGEPFLRNIAACFDAGYRKHSGTATFSKSI